MTIATVILVGAAVVVGVFAGYRFRQRRDPVLRALRDLRNRRGGSRFRTLKEEKAWVMGQTGLSGDELAAKIDAIVIWDPIDESEPLPRTVSLEELPPGKEREEAERLLAELRERREREVPSEARKSQSGKREIEIRAAGDRIDVPFMAPAPKKESMRYSDGRTFDEIYRERDPSIYKDRQEDDESS